jgi:hypothetical protein
MDRPTLSNFVEAIDFESVEPISAELQQINRYQPQYVVIDSHAPYHSPATPIANIQHSANVALPTGRLSRPPRHVCNIAPCYGATFGRRHELRRHHASKHSLLNACFWCPVDGCDRSKMEGGRAFPRKDKMVDHLMRIHGDRVGNAA